MGDSKEMTVVNHAAERKDRAILYVSLKKNIWYSEREKRRDLV